MVIEFKGFESVLNDSIVKIHEELNYRFRGSKIEKKYTKSGHYLGSLVTVKKSKFNQYHNMFKRYIDTYKDDSVRVKGLDDNIPYWYELDPQEIANTSIIPNFRDGITKEERDEFKTKNVNLKVDLPFDHTVTKVKSMPFRSYLFSRAAQELSPNFMDDPMTMINALSDVYMEVYINRPLIFTYLANWSEKYCKFDGVYRYASFSGEGYSGFIPVTDAHYLKRLSVILNFLSVSLCHSKFIKAYPDYLKVLDEVSCHIFVSPIENLKNLKSPVGDILMLAALFDLDVIPMKPDFSKIFETSMTPKWDVHLHPTYETRLETSSNMIDVPYEKIIDCEGCTRNPIIKVIQEENKEKYIKAFKVITEMGLKHLAEMSKYVIYDFCNCLSPHFASGFNQVMTLGGFSQTNPLLDIKETFDKAIDFTKVSDINIEGDAGRYKEKFHHNMVKFFDCMTSISMKKKLKLSREAFRNGVLSYVTSNSAGVGQYKMKLDKDIVGERNAEKLFSFSDKRFVALLEGGNLFRFDDSEIKTTTFNDWYQNAIKIDGKQTIDEFLDNKGDPMKYPGKAGPLVQSVIGIRTVPGGRAIRAIYVVPLKFYLLERLIYSYVDAFFEDNLKDPDVLDNNLVTDKYPNEYDSGNINLKMLQVSGDYVLAPLIMATANPDWFIYWLDYSQFDMTETYNNVAKYKFEGIRKALLKYYSVDTKKKDEYFVYLNGKKQNLLGVLDILERRSKSTWFRLSSNGALIELQCSFMTSGSFDTFDGNTINNASATKVTEDEVRGKTSIAKFDHVRIAGDDNAGLFNVVGANENDIKNMLDILRTVPEKCGFRVNKDKTGVSDNAFEMAKIMAIRGQVIRLGNLQILESEKPIKANTRTELMRGFAGKFEVALSRFPMSRKIMWMMQTRLIGATYSVYASKTKGLLQMFYPNPVIAYANPDVPGGVGCSLTGLSGGEQMLLMMGDLIGEKLGSLANLIGRHIDNIPREQLRDVMSEYLHSAIMTRTFDKLSVTNDQGRVISSAFNDSHSLLASSDLHLRASQEAISLLSSLKIKLNESVLYQNLGKTIIKSSVDAIIDSKQIAVPLVDVDKLYRLFNSELDEKFEMGDFGRRFPLIKIIKIKSTDQIIEKRYRTCRYPTVCEGLYDAQLYMGNSQSHVRSVSSSLLMPYIRILGEAKREGTLNPSLTVESLRDMLIGYMRLPGREKAKIIKNIIISIFGALPSVDALVRSVLQDTWSFSSTQTGFRMTENFTNLDLSDDALKNVSTHMPQVKNTLNKSFYLYYIAASIGVEGKLYKMDFSANQKLQVTNFNTNLPLKRALEGKPRESDF